MYQHWMEHTCVGCGSAYRYPNHRSRTRRLRVKPWVKMRPCPVCGLYQPDMIALKRSHLRLVIGTVTFAVTVALSFFGGVDLLPEWRTTVLAAAVAALALLAQGALLFWNPNRNQDANRLKAKGLIRQGDLEQLRGETPDLAKEELPRQRVGPLTAFGLCGLALGIAAFASAEVVRMALGWPLNPDWYPAVVGPGDESRFFFRQRIYSLAGLWNGREDAELLNAQELGLAQERLESNTRHARWGGQIQFNNKGERWGAERPWVDIRIPDVSELKGKEIRLKLDLVATYPADRGTHFVEEERAFTETPVIQLADRPGARTVYVALCRGGSWGGAVWLLLMGLVLMLAARSFRHEAFPPNAYAETEEDDYQDDSRRRRPRSRRRIRGDDD